MKTQKTCTVCGNKYNTTTDYDDLGFAEAPAVCDDCYRAHTYTRNGYCAQPDTARGYCKHCSLVNYGRDCHNNVIN